MFESFPFAWSLTNGRGSWVVGTSRGCGCGCRLWVWVILIIIISNINMTIINVSYILIEN